MSTTEERQNDEQKCILLRTFSSLVCILQSSISATCWEQLDSENSSPPAWKLKMKNIHTKYIDENRQN